MKKSARNNEPNRKVLDNGCDNAYDNAYCLPASGGTWLFAKEGHMNARTHKTGLVYDPAYKKHLTGSGHPERPERCDAVIQALRAAGFADALRDVPARPATEQQVLACHSKQYLELVKSDVASGASTLTTGDTEICADSLEVALLAAGGVLAAVDAVMAGTVRNAFCMVRPPGHHATVERGMGFCVFNNVAIAARYCQQKHGLDRALIVDWDIHHGNGTQDIFYDDNTVFYFSTHMWPFYPGTGSRSERGLRKGEGYTLNCPFPAGAGGKEIIGAFRDELLPRAETFKPDFVLISAGFDSREGDPLGYFRLTDEDFAELTRLMMQIADTHAGGRLVSVIEGGYSLSGIAAASTAHVGALAG